MPSPGGDNKAMSQDARPQASQVDAVQSNAVAGKPRRTILVVPVGSILPNTGTGQRSVLFHEALADIAPLTVVILGAKPDHAATASFPMAEAVIGIPLDEFVLSKRTPWTMLKNGLNRTLNPKSVYRASPDTLGTLRAKLGDITDCQIVFRYFQTFTKSGMTDAQTAGTRLAVDVDDRDDTKIEAQLNQRLGQALGSLVFKLTHPGILKTIKGYLANLHLIWLAKQEDRFDQPGLNQRVVPNVPASAPDTVTPASQGRGLLFVGSPGYPPNANGILWFLQNCWPKVREACPDATLRIVGWGSWHAVAEKAGAPEGAVIVGKVDDVAQEYHAARVSISPIFEGAGSQIKVIEACAFARPVVATPLSSNGFGSEIASRLSTADSPDAFSDACISLLNNPDQATRTGNDLRALQQAQFSRASVIARIREDVCALWEAADPQRQEVAQ